MGWLFGSDFENYDPPRASKANIEALRDKALSELVFLEGGSFKFGNVKVPVILDGETQNELIYGPVVDEDRAPITIDSFYAAQFEITNHDFDLYAAANDLELRPDIPRSHERQGPYPAQIAYHQAQGYCAWLSEITGQPFSLPTSQQWEYAARSGGHDVAYATQDGTYDYLEQLYRETLDDQPSTTHLPDAFPPNPAGLYAMSSNLAEWVLDVWADPDSGELFPEGFQGDPSAMHRRLWRGSSYRSQGSLNSIFMYGAAGPIKKSNWLDILPNGGPFFAEGEEIAYFASDVGARCVVNVQTAPSESGFGRAAGAMPDDFPTPFAPLPRR